MNALRFPVLACAVAILGTLAIPIHAEKPDMSPKQLRKTATHVVTGKVVAIHRRVEKTPDWKYNRYVAELRVSNCEKGAAINKGDLIKVRYWTRAWVGKGLLPPSTAGHRGLPTKGDIMRIYLARNAYDGFSSDNNDGGFNVIGTNGFEKLPAPVK